MPAPPLSFVLALSFAAACGHAPAPRAECEGAPPVALRFETAAKVNVDEKGNSLATTVRIFLLKSEDKLQQATFDELLDRPAETLGDALLASDELAIFPRSTASRSLERRPGATVVAVVALFREPSGTFWRATRKLPPPDPNHCRQPPAPPIVARLEENRLDVR